MGAEVSKSVCLLVALGVLLAGCASLPAYNPFKIDKSEIKARVKTIALLPAELTNEVKNKDEVSARYDLLITAKLEQAGFKVISADAYAEIWQRLVEQAGGLFNPKTGEADRKKLQTLRNQSIREMRAQYRPDAFLRLSFEPVSAEFSSNNARWDGAEEKSSQDWGMANKSGTVTALSLAVALVDPAGGIYYTHKGGVQLLSHLKDGRFQKIQSSELFADPARDEKAVNIALAPLQDKPAKK